MVVILSTSQIVQKTIEQYRTSQPLLDTKPGTVARDLLIDGFAIRLSELYNELNRVVSAQSIASSIGSDLDKLGNNYGEGRAAQGRSLGPAIFTFSSILSDISIPIGTIVYSKNGVSFRTLTNTIIRASDETKYTTLATKIRADLNFLNITDLYAVEILVECTSAGTIGNISKYSLTSTNISGVSNVTNICSFTGGIPAETDSAYKNRLISVFSGSNTGTELGYASLMTADTTIQSAIVIGPGDPLMLRDNTIIKTDSYGDPVLDDDNEPIILSEGDGGKIDIYVQGYRLSENIESYIYNDKSGQNDPTSTTNDYILGQTSVSSNATLNKRRRLALETKSIPSQPIYNLVEVVGSKSGTFALKSIDSYGRTTGNYSLTKDSGSFAGSSFGFDKLHWVNNYTSLDSEDNTKTVFNGQDQLNYTDVTRINSIKHVITVTNENSKINNTDKTVLQLAHTPIRNIIKVLNVTTGERYVVTNRNPDGASGALNVTGKINISGNSLPSVSDVLQVDYEWLFYHDTYTDFDPKINSNNIRAVIDSVDWGYSNVIYREESNVNQDANQIQTLNVSLPISSVVSVNVLPNAVKCYVEPVGKTLKVNLQATISPYTTYNITNVVSIRDEDGVELYNTYENNGYFDSHNIYFPTDTAAEANKLATIYYNAVDIFTINGTSGSFSDKKITLLPAAKDLLNVINGSNVEVNYIANVNELLPSTDLVNLPISKNSANKNTFITRTNNVIGTQPVTNIESVIITKNLRKAPTKLAINFSGIVNPGVLLIKGNAVKLLENIVFTATVNGLTQDLTEAITNSLGTTSIPSNLHISRLINLQHVETATDNIVLNTIYDYDIVGYKLQNASAYLDEAVSLSTLASTEIMLPTSKENVANNILAGQKLQATFYITYTDVTEQISVSTNGLTYTNNNYSIIDSISIASGFKSNNTYIGSMSINAMNQPSIGTKYKTSYNFTSPKPGERIDVRYNYNSLIPDCTLRLGTNRQLTGDVLVKEAPYILIDVVAYITIQKGYLSTSKLVVQNVANQIASTINNQTMGAALNASDLINAAYQVTGLDSIRITTFNKADRIGQVSKIQAMRNQYLRANSVIVTVE